MPASISHPYSHSAYLFDSLQHGATTLPWLGALADAREARHAVPLAVLQLPVKGVGQQQYCVVNVAVGDLVRWSRRRTEKEPVRKPKVFH